MKAQLIEEMMNGDFFSALAAKEKIQALVDKQGYIEAKGLKPWHIRALKDAGFDVIPLK